jgi:acyl-coenzyme A synthetase/AMP-(fatty) acid ligase
MIEGCLAWIESEPEAERPKKRISTSDLALTMPHLACLRTCFSLRHLRHLIVAGLPAEAAEASANTGGCLRLERMLEDASPSLEAADTSKDDAAFWLYSSGTTGFPKGAVHLHHDMLVAADLYAAGVLGLKESDVCFSVAKLFFAYGLAACRT